MTTTASSDDTPPHPDAATMPLVIMLNPRSGSQDSAAVQQTVEQVLNDAGRRFEWALVDGPGRVGATAERAVQRARELGGAVVAAGGDGTINAVAQRALQQDCPMGVLPQGTFNYFSRVHGIPLEPEAAARALVDAVIEPVQVGRVSSGDQPPRPFLVNASLGLYPQLLQDREAYKREYGRNRLVALWAAAVTLSSAHRPLKLQLQQGTQVQKVRTPTLFVGNNALQLQQTGIPGTAALENGSLVAITLKPVPTLAMLGLMLRGALGRLGDADSVFSFAFQQLSVRPAAPLGARRLKVATDGELFHARAPISFDVWPTPLQLLRPRVPVPVA